MVRVGGEIEVVDCDVGTLTQKFERNSPPDPGGAAGYGCGEGGEEVVLHRCGCLGVLEVWKGGESLARLSCWMALQNCEWEILRGLK